MRTFTRGEKSKLADLTPALTVEVGVGISGSANEVFDISCFGIDANGRLSDDRYFIFYNQKSSPEGAITAEGASGEDHERFTVDLNRLPASIQKLVFTATIDGTGTMANVRSGHLRLTAGGSEVGRFPFAGRDFANERAVMVGEIYLKDVWRFAAVGQGFNGGLSALLAHFGGEEAAPAPTPTSAPVSTPPPPPPPSSPSRSTPPPPPSTSGSSAGATPPPAPVNLGKVTLDKKGDRRTVSLTKGGNQRIHLNLNWKQPALDTRKRGLFAPKSNAPDLDLGCMWELKDGSKGVIQPLGGRMGSESGPPWIYLDKDDRSGAAADGENLYIVRPEMIKRVMVFALIYEGAPDFKSVGGTMTIRDQNGSETIVELDDPESNRPFCAICTITEHGDSVVITKEERYLNDHREADEQYGFGFSWRARRK